MFQKKSEQEEEYNFSWLSSTELGCGSGWPVVDKIFEANMQYLGVDICDTQIGKIRFIIYNININIIFSLFYKFPCSLFEFTIRISTKDLSKSQGQFYFTRDAHIL
jgi:hypothetical protein